MKMFLIIKIFSISYVIKLKIFISSLSYHVYNNPMILLAYSLILKQFWMLFVCITKEKYVLSFYWKNSLDHDY